VIADICVEVMALEEGSNWTLDCLLILDLSNVEISLCPTFTWLPFKDLQRKKISGPSKSA
jgi:hypothetical protein